MDPALYNAAIYGSSDLSEKLTAEGSNIYLGQVTSQNNTILYVAEKSGQRKLAAAVLYSNPSLLHEMNMKGNTALHIAARLGHLEMVCLSLNKAKEQEPEADRSLRRMSNLKGDTALHEAVRNGRYEVSVFLIDEDRDLTCFVNNVGESPLFLAVDRGFYKVALHILETTPKCSYGGRNGMNALHAAVIRTHKCNQFKSTDKQTLSFSWNKCSYIYQFICSHFKFLLSKHELSITGADFVGKVLKKCPSSMMEADDFGWTPLQYAVHLGNAEVVELFLEINHSSIVYITDKEGMSALLISAKEGHVDVMKWIITKCPDTCGLLDDKDRTAPRVAVESRKKKAVKFFLKTLAFQDLINELDKKGNTPLHRAVLQGHAKILEMLASDPRVDKRALNKEGMTAVDIIRSSKQLRELEILKTPSMAALEFKGAPLSLEQKVTRVATEAQKIYVKDHQQLQDTENKDKGKMVGARDYTATNYYIKDESEKNYLDLNNMTSINLLVSTIIATIAFAAAFPKPGG